MKRLDDPPAEFRCPVCRAKQTPSTSCRRCQADLTLTLQVRRRLEYLRQQPMTPEVAEERKLLGG
ncbi:hypothetical protein Pla100_62700 [Neorhodopirellula pilleata]|uniref:Uncharacterized protein n=1 Tax=Neorhodopirellula pilleata TaxID=2714738 RepID=A0A5C5ZFD6_9BACT|nr:hypothetical protein Pla100_62700 [Neorhodopirellula pilleata]